MLPKTEMLTNFTEIVACLGLFIDSQTKLSMKVVVQTSESAIKTFRLLSNLTVKNIINYIKESGPSPPSKSDAFSLGDTELYHAPKRPCRAGTGYRQDRRDVCR